MAMPELIDLFAASALQGLLASTGAREVFPMVNVRKPESMTMEQVFVDLSWDLAEMMAQERERRLKQEPEMFGLKPIGEVKESRR